MSNEIFYKMVKKFCKEQKPPIFIINLVFDANLAINPHIVESVDDIEKLRKSLIASYYSPKKIGKYPPLDLAVEIAKILEVHVEKLVTGIKTIFSEKSVQEKKDMTRLLDDLLDNFTETINKHKEKFKIV
jgi:ribosome-associated translation inhibitor RaiA